MLQVVWFKRDLRSNDHQPLTQAAKKGPVLAFYCLEEEYWQLPDTSQRQWLFVKESLEDLQQQLNHQLRLVQGSVCAFLQAIRKQVGAFDLHSHEETGNAWTYQRDKNVSAWCHNHQIVWHEYPQSGVLRPNPDRDRWAATWRGVMLRPILPVPEKITWFRQVVLFPAAQLQQSYGLLSLPCPGRQRGGRQTALRVLNSFLTQRGQFYRSGISSPLTADQVCSRLSPYLAVGCISIKELFHAVHQQRRLINDKNSNEPLQKNRHWLNSYKAFESRLWWHCHFIQKLEDQPDIEWRNLHPAYDTLRQKYNPQWLLAWQQGKTGWPLVDACMRYLHYHGWLNFRMRAMLISVASYPLWLPWQVTAPFLAQLFVDYDPGIHYPQVQMQAGTTGINIPRMYNPTLQAQKLDPEGMFIRHWVPELRQVRNSWIHQPWLMPTNLQKKCNCIIGKSYPPPLVDYQKSCQQARRAISGIRDASFHQMSNSIGIRHGSRKRSKRRSTKQAHHNNHQLSLF